MSIHNITKTVEADKVAQLTFKCELCNYVLLSNTYGRTVGNLYKTEEGVFERIKKIFNGNPDAEIKKGDKVFIMPGNSLPLNRIKTYLKSVGATQTSDPSKATVIAGNLNVYEEADSDQFSLKSGLIYAESYYKFDDGLDAGNIEDATENVITSSREAKKVASDYLNGITCYVSPDAINDAGHDAHVSRMDWQEEVLYFITPVTLDALYSALAKKLPIVTQDYLNENANSGLDLADEDAFKSIYNMLNSHDDSNQEMARELLFHAKISKTPMALYHLWKLANEFSGVVERVRSKNLEHFKSATPWKDLKYQSVESFVKMLDDDEVLDSKLFKLLLVDIKKREFETYPNEWEFYHMVSTDERGYTFELTPRWMRYLDEDIVINEKIEEDEPAAKL